MNRFVLPLAAMMWAGAAGAQLPPASGILLDSYAAVVNGKVITVGDILAAMPDAHERLSAQYSGRELEERLAEKFAAVRSALVEAELVLLDFELQGGTLPDRAIEDHVNSVIHDQFQNSRLAFLTALAEQRLTYAEWHKQMKDQLIIKIMRQKEVTAKILITPLDLQAAYDSQKDTVYSLPERVRLRTFALPPSVDLTEWIERLRAGEPGAAADVPEGVVLQDDGDFIEISSLNEDIRGAIVGLPLGGISQPVIIAGTLYLVELVERQAARVLPLDEVAPELEKQLRVAEFDRLNKAWIDSLRTKYYVKTFDHALFN